jgi:hypothetical protein
MSFNNDLAPKLEPYQLYALVALKSANQFGLLTLILQMIFNWVRVRSD